MPSVRIAIPIHVSLVAVFMCAVSASGGEVVNRIDQRFHSADASDTPHFQRHVVPLLSRLGCNGRACHGSFQGQGGFQLSLFGYDFHADHAALLKEQDEMRVDVDDPDSSLILVKPTDEFEHEGGQRYEKGSWQHHVLRRWIEEGAPYEDEINQLVALEITPSEIVFDTGKDRVQLKAVAVWSDGTHEDVTPLCRFQSNSKQYANVSEKGLVTAGEAGDTHVVVFYDNGVVPVPVIRPVSKATGSKYPKVPTPTRIDELVTDKLRKMGIVPSGQCSDAEFLRRVSLDMTGTLPAPGEVSKFLQDTSSDKRERKIDELLKRPSYVAWWTTRLCDITGNNDQALQNASPIRGKASQDWYDWIHKRVEKSVPYDELVAGIVLAKSRKAGESYTDFAERMSDIYREDSQESYADLDTLTHYWARRDLRMPEERAIAFAHAFLGVRIQCAQCHKHPFDQWSKQDFEHFTTFFSGVVANQNAGRDAKDEYQKIVDDLGLSKLKGNLLRKELPAMLAKGKTIPFPEVAVQEPRPTRKPGQKQRPQKLTTAKLLGDEVVDLTAHDDIREPLMQWLRDKGNPYFARAFVNRVWASYFHVGIVEPADDMSLANPPSNKALLDYLTAAFIESGYDMKWLHRTIARSRTYQLSWLPNDTNRYDTSNFSRAVPRRLPAEVVYDAIWQATASSAEIAARQKDVSERAISIPGASNRYNRQGPGYALTVFGRSTRDSNCDCDRSMEPSLLQTVYLQNDQDIFALIDRRKGGWLSEVADQFGLQPQKTSNGKAGGKRTQNYKQVVASLAKRIKQLDKQGESEKAARARKKLADYKRQNGGTAGKDTSRSPEEKKTLTEDELNKIFRLAYLRTLSRLPTGKEKTLAQKYVNESEDTMTGVRGVLWALLNTKEFIVNH